MTVAHSELILGGQRSGKSRRAEMLARQWLASATEHRAVFIATAQAWDDEMLERIARHQSDRTERVPGMLTVEEPLQLAGSIRAHSRSDTLIVVDCLTLWLTNYLMPAQGGARSDFNEQTSKLLSAVANASGPVLIVSNEIGLGLIPLGPEVRAFVDALGQLNQQMAQACKRVTLMAAGLPMTLKDQP